MNDEMLIAFQRFLSDTCWISYNHYLSLSENVQQQILESFYNNDCNSDIVRALRNTSPATESKSFLEYLRKHRLSRAVFHQLDNVTKVKIYNNYHQERTLAK